MRAEGAGRATAFASPSTTPIATCGRSCCSTLVAAPLVPIPSASSSAAPRCIGYFVPVTLATPLPSVEAADCSWATIALWLEDWLIAAWIWATVTITAAMP